MVVDPALAQLPEADRGCVLVRADSGGGTKALLAHVPGIRLQYSVGTLSPTRSSGPCARCKRRAWTPAFDTDGSLARALRSLQAQVAAAGVVQDLGIVDVPG